jgi:hypothetical protein
VAGRLVQSLRGDSSLPLAIAQDGHLQKRTIPVAANNTTYIIELLKISG